MRTACASASPRKILPPYLRKTKAIEDLVPWLYLKGISTGEMPDALVHLGFDGSGLSPTSVMRMTEVWQTEYRDWSNAICPANTTCTSGPTASTSAAD